MSMKSDYNIIAESNIFRKYYQNLQDAEQEEIIYKKKPAILPNLLGAGYEQSVRYSDFQYIQSINLWEKNSVDFAEVAKLYAKLHEVEKRSGKVICQIDTNPQNIIYDSSDGKYYLVDFVDWRWEYAEFDLIHHLLFWASAKPNPEFLMIIQEFTRAYETMREINQKNWQSIYPEAVRYFYHRREIYGKQERFINPDISLNRLNLKEIR